MKPEDAQLDQKAQEIFGRALDMQNRDARAGFVAGVCGEDAQLRARVDALLANDINDDFLNPPAILDRQTILAATVTEQLGNTIGRYKLLEKIGEGGMGVVYMAEQREPVVRKVALKIIKLGMDTRQVVARFEAERQALALMDHPHIAKVMDAGATDSGRPFFVMELVQGVPITEFCDQNQLSAEERIKFFIPVCQAIQSAHQKGVIHRDIKPSNVLVTLNGGVPHPMVIDFGVAKATNQKLTEKTLFTNFATMIGTPAYMSPEQAEMSKLDVDTRSDIYSLGVLLYELLTGTTPFPEKRLRSVAYGEMQRIIVEEEPERPSTRLSKTLAASSANRSAKSAFRTPHSALDPDLDWIVMKCLEKDRARRYETANGLAADIQRHLSNEPVVARPPSRLYRFQKTIQRNKVTFAAAAAVLLALLAGLGFSTWTLMRERAARRQAAIEATKSQQVADFFKRMFGGMRHSVALGRDTSVLREIAEETLSELDRKAATPVEVELELRANLATVFHGIGEYGKAEALYRETLPRMRALLGAEHPKVAVSVCDFACVLQHQGKLDESETTAQAALALSRKLHGQEHSEVAEALSTLSTVLTSRGELRKAETFQREALVIYQKVLSPENREVLVAMASHARLLGKLGRHAEAEPLFRRALASARKLFGDIHPTVEFVLEAFANDLAGQRKREEASERYSQLLPIQRKLFGSNDSRVAVTLLNLSATLIDGGHPVEGEPYARECLAIRLRLRGAEHVEIAEAMNNVGVSLFRQDRLAEAEAFLRDVVAMYKKLGTPHQDRSERMSFVGEIMLAQGKSSEMEAFFGDAIAETSKAGEKADLLESRGNLLARIGDWPGVITDFTQAVELMPDNHEYYHKLAPALVQAGDIDGYIRARSNMLARFADTKDFNIAERMAKDSLILPLNGRDLEIAVQLAETASQAPATHPDYLWFVHAKSMADYRMGIYAGAAALAATVLAKEGEAAERDVQACMILALAEHHLDHADKARSALSKGVRVMEEKMPKPGDGEAGSGWNDWIIARALLREAKALIEREDWRETEAEKKYQSTKEASPETLTPP